MNKTWLCSFLLLAFSSISMAGPRVVGNGGVSVVCRDPQTHQITQAYLLDLFEAENMGSSITRSEAVADLQISQALDKIAKTPGVQYEILRTLEKIKKQTKFIYNPSVGLPLTDDALPRLNLKGCKYEQVAIYNSEEQTLTIDSEIYNSPQFSHTDVAALWIHEAIYKLDRLLNDAQNSLASRDLVGQLFVSVGNANIENNFNARFSRYNIQPGQKVLWLDDSQDLAMDLTVSGVPAGTSCSLMGIPGVIDRSWQMLKGQSQYADWVALKSPWSEQVGPWLNGAVTSVKINCTVINPKDSLAGAELVLSIRQNIDVLMKFKINSFKRDFGNNFVSTSEDTYTIRLL